MRHLHVQMTYLRVQMAYLRVQVPHLHMQLRQVMHHLRHLHLQMTQMHVHLPLVTRRFWSKSVVFSQNRLLLRFLSRFWTWRGANRRRRRFAESLLDRHGRTS